MFAIQITVHFESKDLKIFMFSFLNKVAIVNEIFEFLKISIISYLNESNVIILLFYC